MVATNGRREPPSPPGHWLWGHTRALMNDPMTFPVEAALAYKPLCRLRVAGQNMYLTAHAGIIRQVFVTDADNFVKGPAFRTVSLLGGSGLLTSEGAYWKQQRRLAQPAFHKEKLRGFLQTFIDCSQDIARKWGQYEPAAVYPIVLEMGELALRIAGKTMFSIDLYREAASVPPDVKESLAFLNRRIYDFLRPPISWPLPAHRRFLQSRQRLDAVVYRIIDDRTAGLTAGDDLLQAFMDTADAATGKKMTREQLRDEVITLLLAGFETSSIALSWIWYVLWQHKEVRDQFLRELQTVIGDGPVRPEHIRHLSFTRALTEETLRLYPPAYYIQRQLKRDMEMEGYRMKKGSVILTSVLALHKNPDYWKEPEQFRPERFLPPAAAGINRGAYMPFGAGQRICIGSQFALLEIVAVLAVLGRHFYLEPAAGYVPRMIPSITSNILEGMPMHVKSF